MQHHFLLASFPTDPDHSLPWPAPTSLLHCSYPYQSLQYSEWAPFPYSEVGPRISPFRICLARPLIGGRKGRNRAIAPPKRPKGGPICLLTPSKRQPGPSMQNGPFRPGLPVLAPMDNFLLQKGVFRFQKGLLILKRPLSASTGPTLTSNEPVLDPRRNLFA